MGIDYRAAIFVGLPRGEIENKDLIDAEILEVCPPYYDGDSDESAIAGFPFKTSERYSAVEFEWNRTQIDALKSKFKEETGQEAKVYLSPYGY